MAAALKTLLQARRPTQGAHLSQSQALEMASSMTTAAQPQHIDELWTVLQKVLSAPGYSETYASEDAVEAEVWTRVRALASRLDWDPDENCLTSHTDRSPRSATAWEKFCREETGPDVEVLGSGYRLDIVVKGPGVEGTIGIEVKWLGKERHTDKLKEGLGQALLALAHRTRTILVIHCGTQSVNPTERSELRRVADQILKGTRTALVVVP